jgi:hypothetical protein
VVLITAGAPENPRKTCSLGNLAPGGNPGLKRTQASTKKTYVDTTPLSQNELPGSVSNFSNRPDPDLALRNFLTTLQLCEFFA